jgi:hypothetical protein
LWPARPRIPAAIKKSRPAKRLPAGTTPSGFLSGQADSLTPESSGRLYKFKSTDSEHHISEEGFGAGW